ncbi:MAG TPA: Ig-like domain-containing protein [Gemmatimonadales bacterium]
MRQALIVILMSAPACSSDLVLPETGQTIGSVNKISDEWQTGKVGDILPPLVVQILSDRQTPLEGVEVSFRLVDPASGVLTPSSSFTNSEGKATATWTLGTVPGTYTAIALVGVEESQDSLEFHAAAEAAAPDTLSAESSRNQPGQRREEVGDPPLVRVLDKYGNPVPNAAVSWEVLSGDGQVTNPVTTTDAEGRTSVAWTLGNRIGVQKLSAGVDGSDVQPVIFEARVFF